MKKKVLSALLTATLIFGMGMPTFATPNEEVIENQARYDELTNKIDVTISINTLLSHIFWAIFCITSNTSFR